MKTKADFLAAIEAEISNYPAAAQFYQAGDPRLIAQLGAIAAQLEMLSSEIDLAAMEPFIKARESTVLADAAVKGMLPFGRPAKVTINVTNASTAPVTVATGRRLLDGQGRLYTVDAGITVPSGQTMPVVASQYVTGSFTHTVTASTPFYQIQVPAPEGGRSITAIRVMDANSNEFEYKPDFLNTEAGLKMFQLETDEKRRLWITFGIAGIAGFQPNAGDVITVYVSSCDGEVTLAAGDAFAFEYIYDPNDSKLLLALASVEVAGASPLDTSVLRRIVNYPSLYDSSAVYLGNFDYLVRRNLSPFMFLSVWNEQIEEGVRGPSVDNINTIFVSARKSSGGDGYDDAATDNGLKAEIQRVILDADNSYKIKFVPVVDQTIGVTISAKIGNSYDFASVAQQIRDAVLAEYGNESVFSQRGRSKVQYKRIYDLLTEKVQALQDQASDLEVVVTDPGAATGIHPENFRYVSSESLAVTVSQIGW